MILCQAFWFQRPAHMLTDEYSIYTYLKEWRHNNVMFMYENTKAFVRFAKQVKRSVVPDDYPHHPEAKFFAWVKALRAIFPWMDPVNTGGLIKHWAQIPMPKPK